jgi:hypothetical protein
MLNLSDRKALRLKVALLIIIPFVFLFQNIFRPLWFDEALTVFEFLTLPGYTDIYWAYNIPNNHIVYTLVLRLWSDCCETIMPIADVVLRLPSLIFGLSSLVLIFCFWKRKTGEASAFFTALCFGVSLPFIIYGTAVRGYMLSFLLVLVGWEFCCRWYRSGKVSALLIYALCSLLAVGTIPSNLIAFGAMVILIAFTRKGKIFDRKFLLSSLFPLIAFALFYLPLWGHFMGHLHLKEGWSSKLDATVNSYAAFLVSMFPLLIPAVCGVIIFIKKISFRKFLPGLFVALIPLMMIIVLSPAPFPRIFFSLWPLGLFLLARATGTGLKFFIKNSKKLDRKNVFLFFTVAIFIWGYLMVAVFQNVEISEKEDDYFQPYYTRDNFRPDLTAKKIHQLWQETGKPAFVSFDADFPSVMFYVKMFDFPDEILLYDQPKKKIEELPPGSFIVVRSEAELGKLKNRFKLKNPVLIEDMGFQKIFQELDFKSETDNK